MTDEPGPVRDAIDAELPEALAAKPSWWRRVRDLVRRMPSTLARMGGYWGGVIMILRRSGAAAAAFLRRGGPTV